jgi:hypothetical protein
VHKTTLVVNDRKIARARKLLGTKGIRDTVDRALDEVIALKSRQRFAEDMASLKWYDKEVLLNVRKLAWK